MRLLITITIVCIAAILLISGGTIANKIDFKFYHNAFINGLIKYQIIAVLIGIFTMIVFISINPESKTFLKFGNLSSIAEKEKWLGINGKSNWMLNGLQLLLFISIATAVFMFLALKHTNSLGNFQWWFIPFILLFSLTNSFAEEIIFRFGIIAGLHTHYSKITILILSSILFGLPHYFGNPNGVIGILMSGMLGYILCKATYETKGIFIAWQIHFIQDIIIFTSLMMMYIKE